MLIVLFTNIVYDYNIRVGRSMEEKFTDNLTAFSSILTLATCLIYISLYCKHYKKILNV